MSNNEKILRITEAYGIPKKWGAKAALAEKLGTKPGVISGWEKRGVPEKVLVKTALETDADLDWLRSGQGTMFQDQPEIAETMDEYLSRGGSIIELIIAKGKVQPVIRDVILTIETHLSDNNLTLSPEKKAELIMLVLEEVSPDGDINTEKVGKLIKLAI